MSRSQQPAHGFRHVAALGFLAHSWLCGCALAQEAGGPSDPLRFGTDDRFLKLAPFLQLDAGHVGASPDDLLDGVDQTDDQVRRASLYTDFRYGPVSGEFTFDLATDPHPTIVYAYVDYALTHSLELELGQQNGIFSLQDATGARPAVFNENGQNSTLGAQDYVGASLRYGRPNYSLSGGVFGSDVNVEPFGEGWTLMGRGTYAPVNDADVSLHFGLGLIDRVEPETPLAFSGNAGSTLSAVPTISSGRFEHVDSYYAANPEVAATAGRFTFAGEYTIGEVDDSERGDVLVHGGYVSMLAFLTDDHRPYEGTTGTFKRVKPRHPLGGDGVGALEFGARLDYLDLSDAGPAAGTEVAGTGILNWYPLERVRVSASYGFTHVADGPKAGADFQVALARLWFVY